MSEKKIKVNGSLLKFYLPHCTVERKVWQWENESLVWGRSWNMLRHSLEKAERGKCYRPKFFNILRPETHIALKLEKTLVHLVYTGKNLSSILLCRQVCTTDFSFLWTTFESHQYDSGTVGNFDWQFWLGRGTEKGISCNRLTQSLQYPKINLLFTRAKTHFKIKISYPLVLNSFIQCNTFPLRHLFFNVF